jgi:predicted PurR-regulated permease PerM
MISTSPSYFFFGLLLAVMVLAVFIFLPFLTPIVLALALAVIFAPLHTLITKIFFGGREKSTVGAIITVAIIAVIVFVPLILVILKVSGEVSAMYAYLINEAGRAQFIDTLNAAIQPIHQFFPDVYPEFSFDSFNIVGILQNILQWAFANINTIFAEVSRIVIGFFIMCLGLFYFLRDGHELKRQIIMFSPLGDIDDEHIFSKLEQAVRAIFVGSISVAVLQGISIGTSFAIFGVPNPALWGTIASVTALIPGIGTSLVLVPGIIYLFATGSLESTIGLIVWGGMAILFIDNMLGSYLVNRGIKIHQFLILLSVLGGIVFFGPIGFVLGPLVLAFLFSLLEIYRGSRKHA